MPFPCMLYPASCNLRKDFFFFFGKCSSFFFIKVFLVIADSLYLNIFHSKCPSMFHSKTNKKCKKQTNKLPLLYKIPFLSFSFKKNTSNGFNLANVPIFSLFNSPSNSLSRHHLTKSPMTFISLSLTLAWNKI